MKKRGLRISVAVCAFLAILVMVRNYVAEHHMLPFVPVREQWTIGIYSGESPFALSALEGVRNPIMRAEDVTDVPASFVADPFLMGGDPTWYLFFEVYNLNSEQGDIAFATSTDGRAWTYQQIVLDEPFHLSYPYVFEYENDFYLIPESLEADAIRLYKADDFPSQWSFETTLVDGMALVDPSIVLFQDKWWLFAADATDRNDTLRLFFADELHGPWQEHPQSPIIDGDANIARPGGRLLIYEEHLYRFAQDSDPVYGNQIWVFRIEELSPVAYEEVLVDESPLLKADGFGWNGKAMHQVDLHQIDEKRWIAAVDGFGIYVTLGWLH